MVEASAHSCVHTSSPLPSPPSQPFLPSCFNLSTTGNRVATVLMYLTDVEEGGETKVRDGSALTGGRHKEKASKGETNGGGVEDWVKEALKGWGEANFERRAELLRAVVCWVVDSGLLIVRPRCPYIYGTIATHVHPRAFPLHATTANCNARCASVCTRLRMSCHVSFVP